MRTQHRPFQPSRISPHTIASTLMKARQWVHQQQPLITLELMECISLVVIPLISKSIHELLYPLTPSSIPQSQHKSNPEECHFIIYRILFWQITKINSPTQTKYLKKYITNYRRHKKNLHPTNKPFLKLMICIYLYAISEPVYAVS